jgi:branched-chain amino acid transport system ATP-binding protein
MLTVENLVAGYGKVEVLHALSFRVEKGQLVTLIGSNGAGKTTTMRAISGMLKPTAGTIRLRDRDITGLPSHAVAKVGLAHSPEGRRVFGSLTVDENLQLGAFARITGKRKREGLVRDFERVYTLFPRLAERKKQYAGTLSGGEQQMLAMGRALMLDPEILLLDEPSMGLAPRLVEEVFRTIRELRAAGVTMLLVEQFAAAALEVADYAYVMENGHIRHEGPASQLKSDPAVQAAYLGGGH